MEEWVRMELVAGKDGVHASSQIGVRSSLVSQLDFGTTRGLPRPLPRRQSVLTLLTPAIFVIHHHLSGPDATNPVYPSL